MASPMTLRISSIAGQMSASLTSDPSAAVPSGSVERSMSMRPARAKATTSGGLARYDARARGWIRPSKLRLPDSTAATASSLASMAPAMASSSGPELPMQVVQP